MRLIYQKLKCATVVLLVICAVNVAKAKAQSYTIDANYPGGNILVSGIESTSTLYYQLTNDTVHIQPDLRDTKGNWFYWNFRVSSVENRTLVFKFPNSSIGSYGPAISKDGGKSWQWLYKGVSSESKQFQYTFTNKEELRFSSVIPYLQSNFVEFISSFQNNSFLYVESLTISNKGRNIEKVLIQNPHRKPKYRVMLTARHHACEAMANYMLEGIIQSVLNDENSKAKWLRENVAFFIVPFVDKDGVEDGDQGKNRKPFDHLTDYSGESIYKATAAIRDQVPLWADNNLTAVLDFHCPGLRGKWAETIFVVETEDRSIAKEQQAFMKVLLENNDGVLKLHSTNSIIEYGTAWNKSDGKAERLGCREWACEQKGNKLAATMEIAYANNNGQMVTPETARLFGKDLAKAIAEYLQDILHE